MIHLSMNVCKQCETASFLWAKDMPKFSCVEMISGVQKYIKAVDNLELSDFPVMQFKTNGMGGYVAENHRAYMQIAPWSYRWINAYNDPRKNNWVQQLNIRDINSWNKKDLQAWLSIRGVKTKRGMSKEHLVR